MSNGWGKHTHTDMHPLESTMGWGAEKRKRKSRKPEHSQFQNEMDGALSACARRKKKYQRLICEGPAGTVHARDCGGNKVYKNTVLL